MMYANRIVARQDVSSECGYALAEGRSPTYTVWLRGASGQASESARKLAAALGVSMDTATTLVAQAPTPLVIAASGTLAQGLARTVAGIGVELIAICDRTGQVMGAD